MEWIKTSERLPKENQEVIVWQTNLSDKESSRHQKAIFCSNVFFVYPHKFDLDYKKSKGFKNYDLEGDMCQISHWMPLPEPPKE